MRKFGLVLPLLLLAGCVAIFLVGCFKDTVRTSTTYTYYTPVYKSRSEVYAAIKSTGPQQVQRQGKIVVQGHYIFINDVDRGIAVINNADPAHPVNVSFIPIPGNMDLAVKGNILYADLYTDLVALDISDPGHARLLKGLPGIFPVRYYGDAFRADTTQVISGWTRKDTTVSGSFDMFRWQEKNTGIYMAYGAANASGASTPAAVSPIGVGGSTSRFAIVDNRLYAINMSSISVINIDQPENPLETNTKSIGWSLETVFPFKDKLFIGSETGMYYASIANPDDPIVIGQFWHARLCDPVIADKDHAYVTVRAGAICGSGMENELDVLSLANFSTPSLVMSYPLTSPRGLSKDGNLLFVCDGSAGLKIFDATAADNLKLKRVIDGLEPDDVITLNGVALVVAKDGLYQYNYSHMPDVTFLSKIPVSK